jgi:hypothetical protein
LEEALKFSVKIVTAVALLAFAFGAIVMAACSGGGDGDDAQAAADQAALDAVKDQATKAQILAAETVFRVEGMHDLDDTISEATEVDPNWQGKVTRMRRATASVVWPEEMKDHAATLVTKLQTLETALQDENLDGAKAAAPEAHDAWHELDNIAYPYIAGEQAESHDATPSGDANSSGEQNSPSATEMAH